MKTKKAMRHTYFIIISILIDVLMVGCQNVTRKQLGSLNKAFYILAVEQGRGQVKLFDSVGTLLDSAQVGFNPHEIEIDENTNRAYVTNFGVEDYDYSIGIPGTTISVLDLKDLSNTGQWPTYRQQEGLVDTCKGPHGVKLRPYYDGELYVNVEYGDSMLVYDTRNGRIKRTFPIAKGSHNFVFSNSGDILWILAGGNGLYKHDASLGTMLGHFSVTTPLRGIILTKDGQNIILSCQNEVYILDPDNLSVKKHFTNLGVKQIIYSCLGPDEKLLFAPCPYDNEVLVLNVEDGSIVHRLACGKAPIYVRIGPNGTKAFVSNAMDDHMSVIDLKDFSVRPFCKINRPNDFLFLGPSNEMIGKITTNK